MVKGLLSPLEESKSLLVADEFELFVLLLRVGFSGNIDLN